MRKVFGAIAVAIVLSTPAWGDTFLCQSTQACTVSPQATSGGKKRCFPDDTKYVFNADERTGKLNLSRPDRPAEAPIAFQLLASFGEGRVRAIKPGDVTSVPLQAVVIFDDLQFVMLGIGAGLTGNEPPNTAQVIGTCEES